jgi:hypothetical protein
VFIPLFLKNYLQIPAFLKSFTSNMDYKSLLEFKVKVNENGVFLRDAHYFVSKYPCINNEQISQIWIVFEQKHPSREEIQ